jgi:hypothetical protein
MQKNIGYRILNIGLKVGLGLIAAATFAQAQQSSHATPTEMDMYCSGVVLDKPIANKFYVISGEDAAYKTTFETGQLIYINAGGEQGVRIGDQFDVVRPVSDDMALTPWFKYQNTLTHAMGTRYADIGRLRVTHVDAKTSTAETSFLCDPIQRGDLLTAFVARPVPQFHDVSLDLYAAPSGKKTAMVVAGKDFMVLSGTGKIVYINLGGQQGVRIGDYYRVFRYQGTLAETNYQVRNTAYKLYGFGSAPVAYQWDNLPRQILGEGIVLRVGANSSTVLLTTSREEIYAGDYVEVE